MSVNVSEMDGASGLRRSTRNSAQKALIQDLRRPPLKRTKRSLETQAAGATVNGSRSVDDDADDEGVSPSKRSRRESGVVAGAVRNDQNEMDVQKGDLEQNQDQEMDDVEDCPQTTLPFEPKIKHGAQGDVSKTAFPVVELGKRCKLNTAVDENSLETKTVKDSTKSPPVRAQLASQHRSSQSKPAVLVPKTDIRRNTAEYWKNMPSKPEGSSTVSVPKSDRRAHMAEYSKKMSSNPEGSGFSNVSRMNHQTPSTYAENEFRQRPFVKVPNQSKQRNQTGSKNIPNKACSRAPSRGLMWYLWRLVLLALLTLAVMLALKIIPPKGGGGVDGPQTSADLKAFVDALSSLQTRFLSQQAEVWKRSRIHLERHLSTDKPTEPVSLILTAGRGAEKTLVCLAKGMASAFSQTFNASVLHIDGASKANQKSDEVKLDLDRQLQAAFEGDKPAAVIHRLEELPSGSTLIFYRYCDHENAAYKRVFILFTVLLPEEEVSGNLKDVEEMVQEYLEKKLVNSNKQASFDQMDIDKYGGLWSRISHLILPVVYEKEVEQSGC